MDAASAKISIIIPVYNTEKYLRECLESVSSQSFREWECLLIDDGSKDSSGSICDEYAERYSRFRVFHNENAGVSGARNFGIDRAGCQYITFIDSDDSVDNEYLSELYGAMVAGNADLAVCGIKMITATESRIHQVEDSIFTINNEGAETFVEMNRKFLLYGPYIKLYHADIIKNKHIRFPLDIHYGEDLIFNFRYLENVSTIATVSYPGYNYRIAASGTLSSSAQSRDVRNNYDQWEIIRSFFERRGITGESADIFLSNRLWGIAFDAVMTRRQSIREIKEALYPQFVKSLRKFDKYTFKLPRLLAPAINYRIPIFVWIQQRRRL